VNPFNGKIIVFNKDLVPVNAITVSVYFELRTLCGSKCEEDKAGFTGTGGFSIGSGLHGNVHLWSSKAR